ncbi:MAG: hypothetical protein WAO83_22975, partial [Fuerstiella sp.]
MSGRLHLPYRVIMLQTLFSRKLDLAIRPDVQHIGLFVLPNAVMFVFAQFKNEATPFGCFTCKRRRVSRYCCTHN